MIEADGRFFDGFLDVLLVERVDQVGGFIRSIGFMADLGFHPYFQLDLDTILRPGLDKALADDGAQIDYSFDGLSRLDMGDARAKDTRKPVALLEVDREPVINDQAGRAAQPTQPAMGEARVVRPGSGQIRRSRKVGKGSGLVNLFLRGDYKTGQKSWL